MDRQTVYPGQILPETTLLQMAKDSMIGMAKLSAAVLGTSTIANGFAVTPTSPASLQVISAPGELYSLTAIDGTAWSSLAADTTHSIVKQGIALDATTLTCAAPGTTGQSINYLVQASYLDQDSTPVLLPYYNSANPSQPYSGMGNNGLTQNTVRKGVVVLQAKAGAAAATGSQVTPAPDAGYVGLYVVTVAFGQTIINAGNISRYTAAPIIPTGLVQAVQTGAMTYSVGGGAAGAYTAAYAPAITALTDSLTLHSTAIAANTGASTFSPNGLPAKPLLSISQTALVGGELVAGGLFSVKYSLTLDSWILMSATGGNTGSGRLLRLSVYAIISGVQQVSVNGGAFTATGASVISPLAQAKSMRVRACAGGGAGGGSPAAGASTVGFGTGGHGGAYAEGAFTNLLATYAITVGLGGVPGAAGATGGTGGASSVGSILTANGGAGGGPGGPTTLAILGNGNTLPSSSGGIVVNRPGSSGVPGIILSSSLGQAGTGGQSYYGSNNTAPVGTSAGYPGTVPGQGGSGAFSGNSGAAQIGGVGSPGTVIIEEYA